MTPPGRQFTLTIRELPWGGQLPVPVDVRLRQALKVLLRRFALEVRDVREIPEREVSNEPER